MKGKAMTKDTSDSDETKAAIVAITTESDTRQFVGTAGASHSLKIADAGYYAHKTAKTVADVRKALADAGFEPSRVVPPTQPKEG